MLSAQNLLERDSRPAGATAHLRRFVGVVALAAAVAAPLAGGMPASAQPAAAGGVVNAGAPDAVKDSYIVVLKGAGAVSAQSVDAKVAGLAGRHGVTAIKYTYRSALSGFAATMSERQAEQIAAEPEVDFVEQDRFVKASAEQVPTPSWGLDRIDAANLPLNSRYGYPDDGGSKVHAYVIDTGIRTSHVDFGGRATSGFDAIDGGTADDCNGHGTHVAGTIGGASYGVAKSVRLVAVRVLDCNGDGTNAGVIAGVDWVTANAVKPAVANMSLGGGASAAVDSAVKRSIGASITYAVAAGNDDGNACGKSPARVPEAITVGATARNDRRAGFSNVGSCVDIFAPGVDITSAWSTSNTATNTIDGTSMASPHVAGVAALTLQVNPWLIPAQVSGHLKAVATPGKVGDAGSGSPNLLLRLFYGPVKGFVGKCVDVDGGQTPNGIPVQLFECNGSPAQDWQYTGSALYNARSGRCLDVRGGNMANSTPVQIFDCNGSLSQLWSSAPARKELFIRTTTAPRCLDVRGGNPENRTPIQIFDCNGSAAQDWDLPFD